MTTRREFLGGSAALMAASAVNADSMLKEADKSLDILFLGGTGFIGPAQINYALDRGHRVTMFNRGRRGHNYGDRVEEIIGNRDTTIDAGLTPLEGKRTWDVVIDNSGYIPRHVRDSAELLKDRCGLYLYTSTVAVYDFEQGPEFGPDSPMAAAPEPETEEVNGETYGPLKAECDRIAQDILGDRLVVVRPTYVVGPGDYTDRFTYWIERIARGGDVVCPANREADCSWIDVRDLAMFMLTLVENGTTGIYNGVAPAAPVTTEAVMHGIQASFSSGSTLHWPSEALLDELEYPTPMFRRGEGNIRFLNSAAQAAGLSIRPLAETVRDTHEWWQSLPDDRRANPRGWPTVEQERAVLDRMA